MIVSCKEGLHPLSFPVMKRFCNSPGNAHTVISAGSTPYFIKDDKALRRRVPQDVRGLVLA
jgi:hypothetical protein